MPNLEEMWGESFWENPEFEEMLEFAGHDDTQGYVDYLQAAGVDISYDPENPEAFWSQAGQEQWGGLDPATDEYGGPTEAGIPDFWYYEDVEDSAYTDLEDLLYDISGGELEYDDIYTDLIEGYGTDVDSGVVATDSYWDLFLDEFFERDEGTGEYVTKYDPQEFEVSERRQLDIGRKKVAGELESSIAKYRKSTGRDLGGPDLDISDIATMSETAMDPLQEKYRTGVEASTQAWTDDMYASISDMAGELEWEDYI